MPRSALTRICSLLLALLLIPGCRTAGDLAPENSFQAAGLTRLPPVRRSRDILTQDEMRKAHADNAYDALRLLRPEFFTGGRTLPHGGDNGSARQSATAGAVDIQNRSPAIFVNGNREGGLLVLRDILTDVIAEIRYYPDLYTPPMYGLTSPGGIIDVRTKP